MHFQEQCLSIYIFMNNKVSVNKFVYRWCQTKLRQALIVKGNMASFELAANTICSFFVLMFFFLFWLIGAGDNDNGGVFCSAQSITTYSYDILHIAENEFSLHAICISYFTLHIYAGAIAFSENLLLLTSSTAHIHRSKQNEEKKL